MCLGVFAAAQSPLEGSWSGMLDAGVSDLTIVLNFSVSEDGALVCTMDSPDQGASGIKAEVVSGSPLALEVNIASLGVTYKGVLFRKSIMGTFTQMGRSMPLTLNYGLPELRRPQIPQPPFPYESVDVEFTNAADSATLVGTLVLPEVHGDAVPVVLMVSGSGLEDRDETIFEHKPFLVIADFLARNGIASLRYDDRCFGKSHGGDVASATTVDFMHDAAAGLEFLRSDGRFSSVGVLGHSEGASIAFMLGAQGLADFIISLGGLGVKGDEALTAQMNRIYELNGQDVRVSVEQYRASVRQMHSAWMNWFIDYDPSADISATNCPVLALGGDKDCQVISSQNLPAIEALLPRNPHNLVREYPSLNHLFQHCTTGNSNEYRRIEETLSPEVLADIVGWMRQLR